MSLHTTRVIARTEIRRRLRSLQGNTAQLLAFGLMALFILPLLFAVVALGYFGGTAVRTGDIGLTMVTLRESVGYAWLFVVGLGGYRLYATSLQPDRLDGMLTTVSHRELFGGHLLTEGVFWAVPGLVVSTLGALAFAVGARSVLAVPLILLGTVVVLSSGLTGGAILALAIRNTSVRSRLIARLRTLILVLVGIVYVWVIVSQQVTQVIAPLTTVLGPTPVGWLADLLLLGSHGEASLWRGLGAVLGGGVIVGGGAAVGGWLAGLLWYADGVHVESSVEASGGDWGLERYLSRPVAGVVLTDLKRARRAPITLSFVIYPLIILFNPAVQTIQTGEVAGSFPLLVALSGAWITGALVTLNVLGGEGAVLPTTVLSADPGRALVRGHVLTGVALGVPLTVLATVVLGVLSPRSIVATAVLGVAALGLSLAAPALATGIGTVFPRFEEVSVSRSTTAVVPSLLAFAVFSFGLVVVATPAMAGNSLLVGQALEAAFGLNPLVPAVVGTLGSLVLAGPLGVVSMRHARQKVETFTIS